MAQKTSIKIKKFWVSPVASDGGLGSNFKEIQLGQREATVQFNGSDADTTNYKNVIGGTLESSSMKGDKTMNFQIADLTPETIQMFTGGTVTTTADYDSYEAPENENQAIELSVRFLTDKNVLFEMPRVSFDGYPVINDDDLHYYQINSTVLTPTKVGVKIYKYYVLKDAAIVKNDITSFSLAAQTGAATITPLSHTVAITVAAATDITALTPIIGVDLGASVTPNSGVETDFTAPVIYTVTSANGIEQQWTVTVTVAA